jgi:hypothetical protein
MGMQTDKFRLPNPDPNWTEEQIREQLQQRGRSEHEIESYLNGWRRVK